MPKASKATASESAEAPGFEGHYENLEGGYTVGFETYTEDADMAPLFKGLPDDSWTNLPLTGEKVVDMVVTDLAVFTIDKHGKDGMALIELADEAICIGPDDDMERRRKDIAKAIGDLGYTIGPIEPAEAIDGGEIGVGRSHELCGPFASHDKHSGVGVALHRSHGAKREPHEIFYHQHRAKQRASQDEAWKDPFHVDMCSKQAIGCNTKNGRHCKMVRVNE